MLKFVVHEPEDISLIKLGKVTEFGQSFQCLKGKYEKSNSLDVVSNDNFPPK